MGRSLYQVDKYLDAYPHEVVHRVKLRLTRIVQVRNRVERLRKLTKSKHQLPTMPHAVVNKKGHSLRPDIPIPHLSHSIELSLLASLDKELVFPVANQVVTAAPALNYETEGARR